jgi:hypothetical protein
MTAQTPEKSSPVPLVGVSATSQYRVPAVTASSVVRFQTASVQQVTKFGRLVTVPGPAS